MLDEALLPLLPSLVALIDGQSVTRAAQELRISQPRMSARLATLRRLLDDPLLVPASRRRGLVPTARALALAQAVRHGLGDLDRALASDAFDPRTSDRTFAIMANDNAASIVGPSLVHAVQHAGGRGLRFAFHAYDATRLGELEHGMLDIALGSSTQFASMPALIARVILRDTFLTAARASDAPHAMDLDLFCARDHVIVSSEGGGFDGVVDAALARLGRRRTVVASVQSYLLAAKLVASSTLLATLPRALLVGRGAEIALLPPPLDLAPFTLTATWHPKHSSDPAHRWLRDTLFAAGPSRETDS